MSRQPEKRPLKTPIALPAAGRPWRQRWLARGTRTAARPYAALRPTGSARFFAPASGSASPRAARPQPPIHVLTRCPFFRLGFANQGMPWRHARHDDALRGISDMRELYVEGVCRRPPRCIPRPYLSSEHVRDSVEDFGVRVFIWHPEWTYTPSMWKKAGCPG